MLQKYKRKIAAKMMALSRGVESNIWGRFIHYIPLLPDYMPMLEFLMESPPSLQRIVNTQVNNANTFKGRYNIFPFFCKQQRFEAGFADFLLPLLIENQ